MNIPGAMAWKYNAKCADNKVGDDITSWDHPILPRPSKAQIAIDVAEYEQFLISEKIKDDAFKAKKAIDIASLGNRGAMRSEVASANSVPALRALVLKLLEIVYSNEKGTID